MVAQDDLGFVILIMWQGLSLLIWQKVTFSYITGRYHARVSWGKSLRQVYRVPLYKVVVVVIVAAAAVVVVVDVIVASRMVGETRNIFSSYGLPIWTVLMYDLKIPVCTVFYELQLPGTNRAPCTVGSTSDCRSRGRKFESQIGYIAFMELDHEIISMIILLMIQEAQLLDTGERMCTGMRISSAQKKWKYFNWRARHDLNGAD